MLIKKLSKESAKKFGKSALRFTCTNPVVISALCLCLAVGVATFAVSGAEDIGEMVVSTDITFSHQQSSAAVLYSPHTNPTEETQGASTSMQAGNTVEECIWNYWVSLGIEGVSDNPACIAGIMGNFYVESGYNPFMHSAYKGKAHYYGLYALRDKYGGNRLVAAVKAKTGGNYFKSYHKIYGWWKNNTSTDEHLKLSGVPFETTQLALQATIDDLVATPTWSNFVKGLSHVSNTGGPEGAMSYAELFLGVVENAFAADGITSQPFHDSGVKAYVTSVWHKQRSAWQGRDNRVAAAQDVYSRFVSQN